MSTAASSLSVPYYCSTYLICFSGVEAYHIDRAERISADNSVEHRLVDGSLAVSRGFLRKGPMAIGLTSGASTPDRRVHCVLVSQLLLTFLPYCP